MENPYAATRHASAAAPDAASRARGIRWRRIAVWTAAMLVSALVWAFGFAYIVGWTSRQQGASIEVFQTLVYARIATAGLMSVVLYAWFASGITHRLFAHVMLLWLIMQVVDAVTSLLVFGVPLDELLSGGLTYGRTLLWAVLGYAIARLVRAVRAGKRHGRPRMESAGDTPDA